VVSVTDPYGGIVGFLDRGILWTGYNFKFLNSELSEVGRRLQGLITEVRMKRPCEPTVQEVGWTQMQFARNGEHKKKNLFHLYGVEHLLLCRPIHSLVAVASKITCIYHQSLFLLNRNSFSRE
jgi:hypothetical protein